jgi:ssDNA-binding Zn-finger/Zn-ribbon topoisomerase 1
MSPNGLFLRCSAYPTCDHSESAASKPCGPSGAPETSSEAH